MPDLPPDLAGKVLSTDLRNIIKKVGDGSTLSIAEREIMERFLAANAIPEDLVKARRAALIRKWALGGKLTPEERDEIAADIPSTQAVKVRTTRTEYKQSLLHYAKLIGYDSDRTMKRWIEDGRKMQPEDLPPLDDLPKLADWWRRVKPRRKVPDEILRLETTAAPQPAASKEDKASPTGNDAPPTVPGTVMNLQKGVLLPPEMVVQKLRELFAARYEQWSRAVDTNAHDVDSLERKMNEAASKLRGWEKDLTGIQKDRGDVLDAGKLNMEIVSLLTVIAQSFRNAMLDFGKRLAPEKSPQELRGMINPRVDSCFSHFKRSRFSKVYEVVEAEFVAQSQPVAAA